MAEQFLVRFELDVSKAISNANRLAKSLGEVNYALGATDTASKGVEKNLGGQAAATGQAVAANQKLGQSLNSTRYAMYDVSAALGMAGIALVGISALTYGASIAFERDFANVIRTSQVTGDAVDTLRGNFIALQQSIPVSSSDLATIGTLGAQLGVTAENLTAFTRTTAQFAATAGVSVDVAATAFGRLDALLPGVEGNYEALASAILKTGVNSVATEAQIIKTAQQIASISTVVGLSTEEVIGLSSALASLGIPPELSRSVITSTFTKFISAASGGAEAADRFGKVLGITGEQFRTSFQEDALGTFRNLLGVINSQGSEGANTLDDLGLASQRLTPTLLKLAQNDDILATALKDSADGLNDNVELQRQYNVIAGTVAAKLQLLANNFQALTVAIGGTGGVFGGLLDMVNDLLGGLTEMASNPVANFFLQSTVLATGFIGILALVGAGIARTAASLLALGTAFNITTVSTTGARLGLAAILTQLTSTTGGAIATTLAVNGLGIALKGLAVAAIAVTLGVVLKELATMATDASGASTSVDDLSLRLAGAASSAKLFGEEVGRQGNVFAQWDDLDFDSVQASLKELGGISDGFQRNFVAGWNQTSYKVMGNIDGIDDALSSLAQSGNYALALQRAEEFQKLYDLTDVEVENLLDDFYKQVDLAAESAGVSTEEFANAEIEAATATDVLAAKLGLIPEELEAMSSALLKGSGMFVDFGNILNSAQEANRAWAEEQAAATADSTDSWKNFYDGSSVSLADFTARLADQNAAQQKWADNLATLSAAGATSFVTELAKLGPAGAQLAADAVNATGAELAKLEEQSRLAAFLSSQAFIDEFMANQPQLIEAYRAGMATGGHEGGLAAVAELNAALTKGGPELQAVIDKYGLVVDVDADTTPANNTINGFIAQNRRAKIYFDAVRGETIQIAGVTGVGGITVATGGHIRGPGTGTSDSIPARLSDGEYVIKAASVRKYGTGMFDALNRGVAKFASGGPVSAPREVISHASPVDRAIMRGQGGNRVIQLVVNGKVLAEAVDGANENSQFTGSN